MNKEEYKKYLKSERWKELRKHIFGAFKGKCCICNKRGRQVHHTTYENFNTKYEIYDLRLLCNDHHKLVHHNNKWCEDFVKEKYQSNERTNMYLRLTSWRDSVIATLENIKVVDVLPGEDEKNNGGN